MQLSYIAILLGFVVIGTLEVQGQAGWELKSQKQDMSVYFRDSPTSDLKELKITLTVKGQLSSVVALINDVNHFPAWVYKCSGAEHLKQVSPNEMYYYSTIDFPWPLSDRDFIAHSTLHQHPFTKVVTSRTVSVRDYLPEKEDMVRMPLLDITWVMTPIANEEVKIDYLLKSDSGGDLPTWLVNMAVDYGPTQTMMKLKELVQLEAYKNKKLAHIVD